VQQRQVVAREPSRRDQARPEHRDAVEELLRWPLAQVGEAEPVRVPVDDGCVLEADFVHDDRPSSSRSRNPILRAKPGMEIVATAAIATQAATMYGNRLYGESGTGYTLW
jgi:hypothetical protein